MKHFSYVFVFQISVEKSNIQRGELISLLELLQENAVIQIIDIHYLDQIEERYRGYFTHEDDFNKIEEKPYPFAYISFLGQSALVVTNFKLELNEMIRRAGYIQSCGELIFIAKWEDFDDESITNILKDYCINKKMNYPLLFYTKSVNKDIKEKLEGILIDDQRYHIGKKSFNEAKSKIESTLMEILSKEEEISSAHGEKLFIYKDFGIINDNSIFSDLYYDRNHIDYGICYLSMFKKDNTIHYIDDIKEAKPFWAGIFTTPHRLMNAMINLAQVTKESTIVDPFCHTGTVLIEASQIGCQSYGFDINEINGPIDNYNFLCEGEKNFNQLTVKLQLSLENKELIEEFQKIIQDSIEKNAQGLPEIKNDFQIDYLLSKYTKLFNPLENRILFYILRRYQMEVSRGADLKVQDPVEFVRGYLSKDPSIISSPGYICYGKQLTIFENIFNKEKIPLLNIDASVNKEHRKLFEDSIYETNRIGYVSFSFLSNIHPKFFKKDILNDTYDIKDNTIDAIITDPPYGYGEGLSEQEIRSLYIKLFEYSFKWLKTKGFLVFCALDKVKTGRKSGLLFTQDILEILINVAKEKNIKFIVGDLFRNKKNNLDIFYWKSNYALNRSIFSIRIFKDE